MIKYKKPILIELSELETTYGACGNGSVNTEYCIGGSGVVPNCSAGGIPTAKKGKPPWMP